MSDRESSVAFSAQDDSPPSAMKKAVTERKQYVVSDSDSEGGATFIVHPESPVHSERPHSASFQHNDSVPEALTNSIAPNPHPAPNPTSQFVRLGESEEEEEEEAVFHEGLHTPPAPAVRPSADESVSAFEEEEGVHVDLGTTPSPSTSSRRTKSSVAAARPSPKQHLTRTELDRMGGSQEATAADRVLQYTAQSTARHGSPGGEQRLMSATASSAARRSGAEKPASPDKTGGPPGTRKPPLVTSKQQARRCENLYEAALRQREQQEQQRADALMKKERQLRKQCSFEPKVSKYAERIHRPRSLTPQCRSEESDEARLMRERLLRKYREDALLKECTFAPQIEKRSDMLVSRWRVEEDGEVDPSDRLYIDNIQRQQRQRLREAKIDNERRSRVVGASRRSYSEIRGSVDRLRAWEQSKAEAVDRLRDELFKVEHPSPQRVNTSTVVERLYDITDKNVAPPKVPQNPKVGVVSSLLAEGAKTSKFRQLFSAMQSHEAGVVTIASAKATRLNADDSSVIPVLESSGLPRFNFSTFTSVLTRYEKLYGPQPYSSRRYGREPERKPPSDFKPVLSSRTEALATKCRRRSSSVHDALYDMSKKKAAEAEEQRERMSKSRQEEEMAECSFFPKTHADVRRPKSAPRRRQESTPPPEAEHQSAASSVRPDDVLVVDRFSMSQPNDIMDLIEAQLFIGRSRAMTPTHADPLMMTHHPVQHERPHHDGQVSGVSSPYPHHGQRGIPQPEHPSLSSTHRDSSTPSTGRGGSPPPPPATSPGKSTDAYPGLLLALRATSTNAKVAPKTAAGVKASAAKSAALQQGRRAEKARAAELGKQLMQRQLAATIGQMF